MPGQVDKQRGTALRRSLQLQAGQPAAPGRPSGRSATQRRSLVWKRSRPRTVPSRARAPTASRCPWWRPMSRSPTRRWRRELPHRVAQGLRSLPPGPPTAQLGQSRRYQPRLPYGASFRDGRAACAAEWTIGVLRATARVPLSLCREIRDWLCRRTRCCRGAAAWACGFRRHQRRSGPLSHASRQSSSPAYRAEAAFRNFKQSESLVSGLARSQVPAGSAFSQSCSSFCARTPFPLQVIPSPRGTFEARA